MEVLRAERNGTAVVASTTTMSEDELLAAVLELARWLGWRTYHTHDSRRSNPGFPDLVIVRDDRLLFVELKSTKGRLTAEQTEWLKALGYVASVATWRPADWTSGEIERVLRSGEPC